MKRGQTRAFSSCVSLLVSFTSQSLLVVESRQRGEQMVIWVVGIFLCRVGLRLCDDACSVALFLYGQPLLVKWTLLLEPCGDA
ncbi:hypothetical protein OIU85_018384 [Salix viminalis]|uniref:Uncharacterized protein n=1 Tax=Salix viminalis TaxID=40686 RepID=A0A9Q0UTM5_SALVM|nr:hypothetical protein OIU85_018384 [Salix viminalis]